MNSLIITAERVYYHGSQKIRIYPDSGVLRFQCYSGGWVDVLTMSTPLGMNEFRIIAENSQLKVQQLLALGNWGGAEGIDFDTIGSWFAL